MQQKTITLNADLNGLGDLMVTMWISNSTKDAHRKLVHYAKREQHCLLLDLFGQENKFSPALVDSFKVYRWELETPEIPRLHSRCKGLLGFVPREFVAPKIKLTAEKNNLILLFPTAMFSMRDWPACYWIELALNLEKAGYRTRVITPEFDERFSSCSGYLSGSNLVDVIKLGMGADLIICNDSGPAHIFGTLNKKVLAVCGPTVASVFAHMSSVKTIANGDCPCTGCMFNTSLLRPGCSIGCISLHGLSVEKVFNRAVHLLTYAG